MDSRLSGAACGQTEAQPNPVDPGGPGRAPSDATVLFDGRDLSQWATAEGGPAGCALVDGAMECATGAGNIYSKPTFRSAQIHLEFAVPFMPAEMGQARGNSGVYIQGRYEIQILDSYQNATYPTGSCGALYGQSAPLVNASRPPEEWQSYDILFHAPQCAADGTLSRPGVVTVFHNGVLVQDGAAILESRGCDPGPLMLQDHNYPGAPMTRMRFRNVWFRPLGPPAASIDAGLPRAGRRR